MYEGRTGGISNAPRAVADKPRLQSQLDQLEKTLEGCHSAASRIEQAADRLTGPKPQDVAKTAERPAPHSVEQRLAMLIGVCEGLAGRLNDASSQLDAAA